MKMMLRAGLLALFPTWLVRPVINLLGFRIAKNAKVGLSWIMIESLDMATGSRIGHFSRIAGPFSIRLAQFGAIGNSNKVIRAPPGISVGASLLNIGVWSKITSRHLIDMTCSITIGDYSTIAGNGCQLWTHGYVHAEDGIDRYRIDGPIVIEDNVYIGSMSFISMGVRIGKGVIVGGGTSVARDLLEPGLYVSSPIRQLPRPPDPETRPDLELVDRALSEDRVFRKRDR